VSHCIPTATPEINQQSPLDRLTPSPTKKNLNNKQGTENEHTAEEKSVVRTLDKGNGARN
jgi:hypothetical protein